MDLPIKHGGSFFFFSIGYVHQLCDWPGAPHSHDRWIRLTCPFSSTFQRPWSPPSFSQLPGWCETYVKTVCLMCFLARCHQPKWKKTWWFNVCSPAKMKNQMQTWWFFLCDWSSQHVDLPSKHVDFNQRTCDFTPARHGGFRMGLSVGKWLQEPFKTKTV